MDSPKITKILDSMIAAAKAAGEEVLRIYLDDNFEVEIKSDNSPLTIADKEAHRIICERLKSDFPTLPILSEESENLSFKERKYWTSFFLVDPLDGTKEFIKRNGEFTINIALIHGTEPLAGVVYVPVNRKLYYGDTRSCSSFLEFEGNKKRLATRNLSKEVPITIVASRRHGQKKLEAFLKTADELFPNVNVINMGSSIKLCLLAEGRADFYPRLAPTCEWDTAASHAIVRASGGDVLDLNLESLRYNTKDDHLNPSFVVVGDLGVDWKTLFPALFRPD
ncbi:MAG: 3'(2'),5'-bisphosphate nucleotidase CysQ [Pseudomonadota bacterium]|nr:3'(2'),5'-bisphosphate nucleotidase CysQ [Pseudomonadota bacterium]